MCVSGVRVLGNSSAEPRGFAHSIVALPPESTCRGTALQAGL